MAQRTARSRAPDSREVGTTRSHWHRESYVRHRDYSPTLGRFIERDPIGFEAGDNNWYRFVVSGPTGTTDPSGRVSFEHKNGRPPSVYDNVMTQGGESYRSRGVDAALMSLVVGPTQRMTHEVLGIVTSRGFKVAASFLAHYASNAGTPMNVDMRDFLRRDREARKWADGLIRDAAGYANIYSPIINEDGGTFRSEMTYTAASEFEYKNTLNRYGAWIEAKMTCKNGIKTLSGKYQIDDVYDFDLLDPTAFGIGKFALKVGDLALMHEVGVMRAFRVGGSLDVSATWRSGDLSSISIDGLP